MPSVQRTRFCLSLQNGSPNFTVGEAVSAHLRIGNGRSFAFLVPWGFILRSCARFLFFLTVLIFFGCWRMSATALLFVLDVSCISLFHCLLHSVLPRAMHSRFMSCAFLTCIRFEPRAFSLNVLDSSCLATITHESRASIGFC